MEATQSCDRMHAHVVPSIPLLDTDWPKLPQLQLCLQIHAPSTDKKFRVVVTKDLPGDRWLQTLLSAGCQVDICKHSDTILSQDIIKKLIAAGDTHGVLGQLTEVWHS